MEVFTNICAFEEAVHSFVSQERAVKIKLTLCAVCVCARARVCACVHACMRELCTSINMVQHMSTL